MSVNVQAEGSRYSAGVRACQAASSRRPPNCVPEERGGGGSLMQPPLAGRGAVPVSPGRAAGCPGAGAAPLPSQGWSKELA